MDEESATRRTYLVSGVGIVLTGFAGCLRSSGGAETVSDSDTGTSEPRTPTESTLERLLPQPGDGWTLLETGDVAPVYDVEGTIRGDFRSPDGTLFRVIVINTGGEGRAGFEARRLACEADWSIALQYRTFAIAASTGTSQKSFTPERPPQMTRTPVPGTGEEARTLLLRSPELTEETLREGMITDC